MRAVIATVFLVTVVLFGVLLLIPSRVSIMDQVGDEPLHFVGFLVLSALAFAWVSLVDGDKFPWSLISAGLLMGVLAVMAELIQVPISFRSASVHDLVLNIIGVVVAGAIVLSLRKIYFRYYDS